MNSPLKTNKLIAKINYEEFEKRYDIFLIKTSDKYLRQGSYILDTPLLCNNVLSIFFESGREFYVLVDKSDTNKVMLKKVISESKEGDTLTFSLVKNSQVKENILVQLLLNSLTNYSLDILKFKNLSGHFYCFNPKWEKKGKYGEKYVILKVPCLELKVSDDMLLVMQVHTFTTELLKNKITFRKKKFEEYPKYVFGRNNTLRRRLKTDTGNGFIMRQTDGSKTEIPFLDIQNKDNFDITKMGVLANIIEIFHQRLGEVCQLEFYSINNYVSLDRTRKIAKENDDNIRSVLQSRPIKIIDKIKEEYSSDFCMKIKHKLEDKYLVNVTIGKRPSKDALNILVIHNASFYDGKEDQYMGNNELYTVQHITFEDFNGNEDFALSTITHELLIKDDILHGKITLFDWKKLGINENIMFGLRSEDEENRRYFFMEIKGDGSFTFKEQTLDLFELNNYTECVNIFEDNPLVRGIIKRANGDINIIYDTKWITIPEIAELKRELGEDNTHLRGKEKRNELLSSILDIKLFDYGSDKYYFVGTIGEGMRQKIINAANIRKISAYKNSQLMFEDLLPLMNVPFVHNGQLTAIPFPFKYLREYIKMVI